MKSQSYRDLLVWQKSIELCIKVYEACRNFPRSETYGLMDQMIRKMLYSLNAKLES